MSKALEKAIGYLKEYAEDDEIAGLNGNGCYRSPTKVIEGWIRKIRFIEKEEKNEKSKYK